MPKLLIVIAAPPYTNPDLLTQI